MPRYEIITYWSQADDAFYRRGPRTSRLRRRRKDYKEALANVEIIIQESTRTPHSRPPRPPCLRLKPHPENRRVRHALALPASASPPSSTATPKPSPPTFYCACSTPSATPPKSPSNPPLKLVTEQETNRHYVRYRHLRSETRQFVS